MKKILSLLCVLLPILLQAQEAHIYDTVKATQFDGWIQINSGQPTDYGATYGNRVGYYNGWEWRLMNEWKWTYSNIPTQATVTSVEIRFKTNDAGYKDAFTFTLHVIPDTLKSPGINFFNQCNSTTQVDDDTITCHTDGYNYFDKVYTSGALL